jgi:hypothetical protein
MKNKCKVPNISAIDNNVQSLLRLGEFYFVVKQEDILEEKGLGGASSFVPHVFIFKGSNLCKCEEKIL